MISVGLKNPALVVMPISEDEVNKEKDFSSIYVLYKNKNDEIEIGIPDMMKYNAFLGNMYGWDNAGEKAFFLNGASLLQKMAPDIEDRPVYYIEPTDDRKVASYKIINSVNVKLTDILNGTFTISDANNNNTEIEKTKQLKHK